ncbi:MAG TPA: hypothetical protein VI451_20095 [Anaerolineales bacterium]|nr:hypothetical protein [Anaerolineales bacterium]
MAKLNQGHGISGISNRQVTLASRNGIQVNNAQNRVFRPDIPPAFLKTEHFPHPIPVDDNGWTCLTKPPKIAADDKRIGHPFALPRCHCIDLIFVD